ncbi:zinc-binding dehydrogenase [Streptomyces sp. YC504]|uniref:2-deoxy-scyllo-inosamine dehydrogenase n=1 Tax=Streptomyces mesophilus TaxID=1775132 RepID=A0A6G4XCE0_9ACTN|nr:zinc-binding dehydrogenase [Streptomyces mesophilus]NGO74507.1 zinc-binding dehydrogenase [Streptomyces mesophilus]
MAAEALMKVAALDGPGVSRIIEKPLPLIAEDYVLVKVLAAPMCNEHLAYEHWDFRDRNRWDSLGHEAAGEVVDAGSGSAFRPGDRVVVLSGYPCGRCALCTSGRYAHCEDTEDPLTVSGGESGECGFAQYMIKREHLLIPIPEGMSYEHAAMACCGMGATYTAMENMEVAEGQTVLVTGLGQVGLGAVINGRARGARMICAGRSPYRRELARELGADLVVDMTDPEALSAVREFTGGSGVDRVIDCSAQAAYQRFGLDAVGRGGQVTFLGESGELEIHVDRDLIQKGVTLHGSLDLYLQHAPGMLDVIARSGALIDRFITHTFPLDDIEQAWKTQLTKECGKVVLHPWP